MRDQASRDRFEPASEVADAVLWEGYLLYPYRSSSGKNQRRWQFGVVGTRGAHEAGVGEEPTMQTECLLAVGPDATLDIRLRFLQLQARQVEAAGVDGFLPTPSLTADGQTWLTWDEAVAQTVDTFGVRVADLLTGEPQSIAVEIEGGEEVEPLPDGVGRLVRRRLPLSGRLHLSATTIDAPQPLMRVRARFENLTPWPHADDGGGLDQEDASRRSFIGTHTMLAVSGAGFVSLLDPPDWAAGAAAACENHRTWPVLAGVEGDNDVVLSSPVILYDYPAVAPESPGALFDSTEIDEILTLRIMTLTDDEKAEARATDPRAAAIVDRCDTMPGEMLERLHGAVRYLRDATTPEPAAATTETAPAAAAFDALFDGEVPVWGSGPESSGSPGDEVVVVAGVDVARGSAVRIRPTRRADAHDMFFAGRTAKVTGVFSDLDGEVHVAVTIDDDPASELHEWYGRYLYFAPDELEPLEMPSHG